jgi:hypothetical protein
MPNSLIRIAPSTNVRDEKRSLFIFHIDESGFRFSVSIRPTTGVKGSAMKYRTESHIALPANATGPRAKMRWVVGFASDTTAIGPDGFRRCPR